MLSEGAAERRGLGVNLYRLVHDRHLEGLAHVQVLELEKDLDIDLDLGLVQRVLIRRI